MISPARATGILAVGTIGTLLAGVVVAKALAILTGPEGVGLYGLIVSLLGLGVIVFGLGVGTGIVRATARAIADGDEDRRASIGEAGTFLAVGGGLVGGTLFALFREPIAAMFLGGRQYVWAVVVIAPGLLLQLAAAVELGYLNGHHRVRAMAIATAGSSLAGAAVVVALVAARGVDTLPVAVVTAAALAYVITTIARRRSIPAGGRSRRRLLEAGRWLIGFGGRYTLSQLVGTGAQLLVPVIVLSLLGPDAVGYVRAASAIAIGYLATLLSAMARDYYPRAAAAEADQTVLRGLVGDQTRLVVAVAAPLILATSALAPLVIAVLYSDAFSPASAVLQWLLVGDVLKLLSWTGSFVILARGSPARFFVIEAIGGLCLLITTLVGVSAFGPAGVGIGYAITYAIYLVVVWIAAGPIVRVPLTREVLAGIGLAAALALFQVVRPSVNAAVATAALLGAAAFALAITWRTIRSGPTGRRGDTFPPAAF